MSKHRVTISAAIPIPFNPEYLQFMIMLAHWASFLQAWNTGCYCHPSDFKTWFPSTFKCCLGGFRDELEPALDKPLSCTFAKLSAKLLADCTQEGIMKIIRDYSYATSALLT